MAWTYGYELCVAPSIPVGDWVYGDELCTTLPTEDIVYPTDSRVRVTSLVHRWSPGQYLLEINLGELTAEFAIPDVIKQPREAAEIPITPRPDPNACYLAGRWFMQDDRACVNDGGTGPGRNLARCSHGSWWIISYDNVLCYSPLMGGV